MFYWYSKDSAFIAFERDAKTLNYVRERGTISVKNGIEKGKELDLGVEPPP